MSVAPDWWQTSRGESPISFSRSINPLFELWVVWLLLVSFSQWPPVYLVCPVPPGILWPAPQLGWVGQTAAVWLPPSANSNFVGSHVACPCADCRFSCVLPIVSVKSMAWRRSRCFFYPLGRLVVSCDELCKLLLFATLQASSILLIVDVPFSDSAEICLGHSRGPSLLFQLNRPPPALSCLAYRLAPEARAAHNASATSLAFWRANIFVSR